MDNRKLKIENRKCKGAQPGNLNALKHGLYSAQFKAIELKAVDKATQGLPAPSVSEEIAMSRLILKRLVDRVAAEEMPLETNLRVCWIIIQSACRIGRMLALEQALVKNAPDTEPSVAEIMSRALEEALFELGINDPSAPNYMLPAAGPCPSIPNNSSRSPAGAYPGSDPGQTGRSYPFANPSGFVPDPSFSLFHSEEEASRPPAAPFASQFSDPPGQSAAFAPASSAGKTGGARPMIRFDSFPAETNPSSLRSSGSDSSHFLQFGHHDPSGPEDFVPGDGVELADLVGGDLVLGGDVGDERGAGDVDGEERGDAVEIGLILQDDQVGARDDAGVARGPAVGRADHFDRGVVFAGQADEGLARGDVVDEEGRGRGSGLLGCRAEGGFEERAGRGSDFRT